MSEEFDVGERYDAIAERYLATRSVFDNETHLTSLAGRLEPGASVLDVGCGSGVPVASTLSSGGFSVLGIDASRRQIELARANVPGARFEVADMKALQPSDYSVDCVVAFYSVYHVPREMHANLYAAFHGFLSSRGGLAFLLLGTKDWDGYKDDFHGGKMYWSSFSLDEELKLIEHAGFTIESVAFDGAGGERHSAVYARAR